MQEVTASLATTKQISLDAATAAVLSEPDGMFVWKEGQKTPRKVFLHGKDVFALLLTGSSKSLVKHHRASQPTMWQS